MLYAFCMIYLSPCLKHACAFCMADACPCPAQAPSPPIPWSRGTPSLLRPAAGVTDQYTRLQQHAAGRLATSESTPTTRWFCAHTHHPKQRKQKKMQTGGRGLCLCARQTMQGGVHVHCAPCKREMAGSAQAGPPVDCAGRMGSQGSTAALPKDARGSGRRSRVTDMFCWVRVFPRSRCFAEQKPQAAHAARMPCSRGFERAPSGASLARRRMQTGAVAVCHPLQQRREGRLVRCV
mmetsp:Transcript_35937/g.106214  ORF Transcript_35937/g.106214 Transcript_35937/m.106214 type:complete len:236 (+) Transcript_35937:514-1221(+)